MTLYRNWPQLLYSLSLHPHPTKCDRPASILCAFSRRRCSGQTKRVIAGYGARTPRDTVIACRAIHCTQRRLDGFRVRRATRLAPGTTVARPVQNFLARSACIRRSARQSRVVVHVRRPSRIAPLRQRSGHLTCGRAGMETAQLP